MPHRPFPTSAESPAHPGPGRAGWRAALVAGVFLFTATPAFPAGLLGWLFHRDLQVITSTDATPAGALRRPPSPSDPVYYQAMSVGYHDFGAAIGGDRPPEPQEMIRTIMRVLAKVGYLPADAHHSPTQLIIFAWGTLYPEIMPKWDPDLPDVQRNHTQMLRFLGADKLGLVSEHSDERMRLLLRGLSRFDPEAKAIWDVAEGELYVVALAGYEFPVTQPEHRKLLWRTHISCPATGLGLADTLPAMLAIATPYIGRATGRPVWVNASDKFKFDVRIGNPKFEEYLESGQLPVYGEKAAPANAGRGGK